MARQLGVKGAVVLATCNRLEMYVQLHVSAHVNMVRELIVDLIAQTSGLGQGTGQFQLRCVRRRGGGTPPADGRLRPESAVAGERECRSGAPCPGCRPAKRKRTASPLPGELVQLFEHAAHTARQVGQRYWRLAPRAAHCVCCPGSLRIVARRTGRPAALPIFGTGASRGATIAALRESAVAPIFHLKFGRAPEFAAKRDVFAVPEDGMEQAMAELT